MFTFVSQLFARSSRPMSPRSTHRPACRFRPQVEGFEDRIVPAASIGLAPHASLAPALVAPASTASVLPINITSTTLDPVTGAVSAIGPIGSQAFNLGGQLSLTQAAGTTTPILDLHVNAIHLDVLGLQVDTSNICLNISATSGPGQLLGNLLTDVANLLNNGGVLPTLQSVLSGVDLTGVEGELTQVLNQGLGTLFSPTSINPSGTAVTQAAGATSILHLSLGPVDVHLLGLNVHLDNCANGPVTVDITAQSGPGRLLGNLLSQVAHLLDGQGHGHPLANALTRVAGAIDNILGQL
jgi:hypothetical protein